MATEKTDPSRLSEASTIKLFEEAATVSTRERVTGRVRVTTKIDNFEEVARATLEGQRVDHIGGDGDSHGVVPQLSARAWRMRGSITA